MDITFADVKISDQFKVIDIKRSILPPRENFSVDVPSRHGAYYTGYKYQPREIEVVIAMVSNDLNANMRGLAWMLDLEEPSELIFGDEPDKVYYAVVDGSTEIESILKVGTGSITFLCLDPFAYSTVEKTFTADANGKIVVDNQGTVTVAPTLEVNFTADCGYVAFVSPNGVVQIGNPKEIDGVPLPDSERLINDAMTATTGWTVNTSGKVRTPSATIQGTIATTGSPAYGIKPSSYGTAIASKWYGMTMRKDLPVSVDTTSTAQNFQAEMTFEFKSGAGGVKTVATKELGRLEFNIMDDTNNFLAGFTMRDSTAGYEFTIPEFYVGNTLVWSDNPTIPAPKKVKQYNKTKKKYEYKTVSVTNVGKWNDFYGKIIIRKSGSQFYFELQKLDANYKVIAKATKTWYDTAGTYTAKKAKTTNIWFGKYGTNPNIATLSATHVYFRKDNVADWKDFPNLFGNGDKLIVDCSTSQVYLNDSLFMDKLDIGSTFFELEEGQTEIQLYHSSYAGNPTTTAKITEKFL